MGTWASKPWDNDSAADWYGDLMDHCKVRDEWLKGINTNIEDEPETVRAAIGLFIFLGRVYIWPIKEYDKDLALAIDKCGELLKNEQLKESQEIIDSIKIELIELQSRIKESKTVLPMRPWWKIW